MVGANMHSHAGAWERKNLSDVAPSKPLKNECTKEQQQVWQLNLNHIESNTGKLLKKDVQPYSLAGNSNHWFDERHVLYSKLRPYLNKVLLPSEKGLGTTELVPMLPDEKRLNRRFLAYYLRSKNFVDWISTQTAGAKMPRVSMKVFWNHEIPLPPLAEQKKIAAILDAADRLRQKDAQLIAKYKELSQSLFLDIFGGLQGETVSLNELCEVNPKKSEIISVPKSTQVSFIPMTNVSEEGEIDLSETKELSEVWTGFTYFSDNDVLFAKITPCMENGKGGIAQGLISGIGFGSTEFHVLRPIKNISTPTWIYHLSKQLFFRKLAQSKMAGAVGHKRVPKTFFDEYKVVAPPITLQNQFAERIQHIEAQKQQAQATLQKSNDLFHSLLQRAFKGELTA